MADLKLTSEEDAKLAAIAADSAKDDATAQKDMADAQGDQQKMQDLRTARQAARKVTQDKAMAVLTETQKTMLTKYQKDHPAGNRGGNGGNRQAPPATPVPAPAGERNLNTRGRYSGIRVFRSMPAPFNGRLSYNLSADATQCPEHLNTRTPEILE